MWKLIFAITCVFSMSGLALADQNDPRLERLFNQLAATRTPAEAGTLVAQIDAIWNQSGSDTVDLLMSRAGSAIEAQDFDTAMQVLNILTEMRPQFAEAWYRRAELLLAMDSQQEAAADLVKAVRLEPRHFRAHALIGRLADNAGLRDDALTAYKRALMLDPMYEPVIKRATELSVQSREKPGI
jgi:tetratricopeptide (TPR) repeat protein